MPDRSSATDRSLVGTRLGDYQVLRKLGRGGMADVYAARHLSLNRDLALKVLRREFASDRDYVERFRREARAAAKLNHINIVQVFDVGSVGSRHYIAQELIDGPNLRESLERDGPISPDDAVRILIDVASALEVACDAGITHRDIKPENIMRSARDTIKVADFGLARVGSGPDASRADLTQVGLTLGTPRYMSPEQVQGASVDTRSDLYSLGVTLYHLLAGRPPFEADDPLALAVMHLHETPLPLDRARNGRGTSPEDELPDWLIAVISRLMSKLPADRFQSPSELLDAVRNQAATSNLDGFGMGTAAATIRLQRAADQARAQRRRKTRRIAAAVGLPLLCMFVALWAVREGDARGVEELLRSETVSQAESVQEQYFNAMNRNDEAGWRSLARYYPPSENSTNASYHAKAMLQLARLLIQQEQFDRADLVLRDLLSDPTADRTYQMLAWVQRSHLLKAKGDTRGLAVAKDQMRSLYTDLQSNNPRKLELVRRVIPEADWNQLVSSLT